MKIEHKSEKLMVLRDKPLAGFFISGVFMIVPIAILFFAPWQENPSFLVAPAIIFLLGIIFLFTTKSTVVAIDLNKEMVAMVTKRMIGKPNENHVAISTIQGVELERKLQTQNKNRKWLYVLQFKTADDKRVELISKSASTLSVNGFQVFNFTRNKLKKIGIEVAEFIGVPFL